jgi:hypothetical protein
MLGFHRVDYARNLDLQSRLGFRGTGQTRREPKKQFVPLPPCGRRPLAVRSGSTMQVPSIVLRVLRPPPPDASKEERLRFVRRCALLPLPGVPLLWILVIFFGYGSTWLLIPLGVSTGLGLETVASLSWRIRRLRAQSSATSAPNAFLAKSSASPR